MVTPRKPAPLYDEHEIANRIEDERKRHDISVKEAADVIGAGTASTWYKKADGTNPFTVADINRFCARINAPLGWPFLEWSAALFLQRELPQRR